MPGANDSYLVPLPKLSQWEREQDATGCGDRQVLFSSSEGQSMAPFLFRVAAALACAALCAAPYLAGEKTDLPRTRSAGKLELVATFHGPMPTGVTVSRSGRVFVNFPR